MGQEFTFNALTGKLDLISVEAIPSETDPLSVHLTGNNSLGVVVTRTGGYISSLALSDGRTLTVNRSSGYISSITDGTTTWTATRDGNGYISTWGRT